MVKCKGHEWVHVSDNRLEVGMWEWKGGSKYSPYYQNLYGFNLPTCKDFGINKKCKEYAIVKQSLLNGGYDYYCGNCAFDRQTQDKFKRTRRY